MINNWLPNIQDWLLPRLCPGCGMWTGPGKTLCSGCESTLPRLLHACPRCAIAYDHPDVTGTCGECQRRPPAQERTLALYRYAPPVDHFIRALKFHRELGLAPLLGERLALRLAESPTRPELILPVPLHTARLRSRGYNQSLEIARVVARRLAIPLDAHLLTRTRATAPQSDLPLTERRKNVKGAFAVREQKRLTGKSVALLDDVMTSGNTIHAAAQALIKAGAREVEAWVVARA
ncbi:MAG: ComF family protein [Gammaproteobacteria bacterium]|nr:ComF family protein [Gammaproteobacteria bacterium]